MSGSLSASHPGPPAVAGPAHGWQQVRLGDVPPSPWRNGGGITRELLAWPGTESWRWRLSVADITADGPFSSFPGVTRWFTVLEGAGVRLEIDGHLQPLDPASAPIRFDGGSAPGCWLQAGPTRDFNLMSRGPAHMRRVQGQAQGRVTAGTALAVYAHTRPVTVVLQNTDSHGLAGVPADAQVLELPAQTLAWRYDGLACAWEVRADDALWMEMTL